MIAFLLFLSVDCGLGLSPFLAAFGEEKVYHFHQFDETVKGEVDCFLDHLLQVCQDRFNDLSRFF